MASGEGGSGGAGAGGETVRRLILDTDGGVDDAVALGLLLGDHGCNVELMAITTVAGNVDVEQATRNVRVVCGAYGRTDIPVYSGATRALLSERFSASDWHGSDGLGDADLSDIPLGGALSDENAVFALVRMLREAAAAGRPVEVLTIGPMTNLALAVRVDASVVKGVSKFWFMGGTDAAKGNASATAEFNIFGDPEAAAICLSAFAPAQPEMITWEATVAHALDWDFVDAWRALPTARAAFLKAHTQFLVDVCLTAYGREVGFFMPDPLAAAVVLDPSIVKAAVTRPAAVELSGRFSRGLVAVDWRTGDSDWKGDAEHEAMLDGFSLVRVVKEVDMDAFKAMLRRSVDGTATE